MGFSRQEYWSGLPFPSPGLKWLGLFLFFKMEEAVSPTLPPAISKVLRCTVVTHFIITFVLIFYLLKVDQKGKRYRTLHSARGIAHGSLEWLREGGIQEAEPRLDPTLGGV